VSFQRGLGGVSPYKQISDGLSGRINCRNGGCVRTHPMLAVLVQIPVGDLRVLAASAACLKLIVAFLPQKCRKMRKQKTATRHKDTQ